MTTDVELERALAAIAAAANDRPLEEFDQGRVQEMVTQALEGQLTLTVDEGGGLHDQSGARVGIIRRTDSGEWITERQNPDADHADAAIPRPRPQSKP